MSLDYVTLVVAWTSVSLSIVSLGLVGYKAYHDSSRLRYMCVVMSLSTVGLTIANALRINSQISEAPYLLLRTILMILFVDLLVAITLNLGGNFYTHYSRVNRLYWVSIAATAMLNVMVFSGLILQYAVGIAEAGAIIINVERCSWPLVVFLTYWYAFHPVVNHMSDTAPTTVVAVGTWYLVGMGILLLLEMITIILSIPYPSNLYKTFDINRAAVSIVIRMTMINIYCCPPSRKLISSIRKLISLILRIFFCISWESREAPPDPPREMHHLPSATETKDDVFASSTTTIIQVLHDYPADFDRKF